MKKKLLFVVLGLMVLLFVGCKEAPISRELVVVNEAPSTKITGIEVEEFLFGQRKTRSLSISPMSFPLLVAPLQVDESFSITLSPYIYSTAVEIYYKVEEETSSL